MIDIATGREKWSVPLTEAYALVGIERFSLDANMLFGSVCVYERPKKWEKSRTRLEWRSAASGREVFSFECEKNDIASFSAPSPDGQVMAVAINWYGRETDGGKKKLLLFNVAEKKLLGTVLLSEKTKDQRQIVSTPVFRPDGKCLAVVTRVVPKNASGDIDPRDLPQPRILLIETATGEIRETLIAPQAFANAACFSPDGQTLATGGHGRVLLWDMTNMPQ